MFRSIKTPAIALLLIAAGVVILFSTSKERNVGPASRAVYSIVRPFQQAFASVRRSVTETWGGYVDLRNVRRENQDLRREIEALRKDKILLQNQEGENRRLHKLLQLKTQYEYPSVIAQVIAEDASGLHQVLFINRGSDDGIAPNMPVVVTGGIVGRILKCGRDVSKVLIATDPGLSADARVVRTRDRGVVSGLTKGKFLMRYINPKSTIAPGDEVITSGLEGIFPKGIPLGPVESIGKMSREREMYLEAVIQAKVDPSQLEEVIVILSQKSGFDVQPSLDPKAGRP
jgi:rod shape-determining protein MreC